MRLRWRKPSAIRPPKNSSNGSSCDTRLVPRISAATRLSSPIIRAGRAWANCAGGRKLACGRSAATPQQFIASSAISRRAPRAALRWRGRCSREVIEKRANAWFARPRGGWGGGGGGGGGGGEGAPFCFVRGGLAVAGIG